MACSCSLLLDRTSERNSYIPCMAYIICLDQILNIILMRFNSLIINDDDDDGDGDGDGDDDSNSNNNNNK